MRSKVWRGHRSYESNEKQKQEPITWSMQLPHIPVATLVIDWFIFRSSIPWMRLPWKRHDIALGWELYAPTDRLLVEAN